MKINKSDGGFTKAELSSLWGRYKAAWRKADQARAERARTGTFEIDLQPKGHFPFKFKQKSAAA